jgi:hypothetical protein
VEETGLEVCDSFDFIVGSSTGAIIAFLIGLRRGSCDSAKKRYDSLINDVFASSSIRSLIFTTGKYDEKPFEAIIEGILGDATMVDSRADSDTPFVFALSSKMRINANKVALFRNYNYATQKTDDLYSGGKLERGIGGGKRGNEATFVYPHLPPGNASRYSGSFRIPQKVAMRATTAAPTFFTPLAAGEEVFTDGGLVASNPTGIAYHEARSIFPDVPVEL